jgi:hypothetical protein
MDLRMNVLVVACSFCITLAGCGDTEARSKLRDSSDIARNAALSSPDLSESARSRISSETPRIASFVDMGVVVDCSYIWIIDDKEEIEVRYHGEPGDRNAKREIKIVARKEYAK